MTFKLVAVVQILAMTLLAGCSLNTLSTSSDACKATADLANPYQEVAVSSVDLTASTGNPNNIIPAPVGGCPTIPLVITDGKISICHATNIETNPYDEIIVSTNGLDGHGTHVGDIIPAPEAGCPTSPLVITDGKITICHATSSETNPYNEITVIANGLNGHGTHTGDIFPAPVGGCPTSPVVITNGKINICYATSIETNPYNQIAVSVNGLDGYSNHKDDLIPAPEAGCPTSKLVITDGKITICHATSSETNPFNEITVSVNGLNGHGKHTDDIIPVPVGGCPTTLAVIKDAKITICHATSIEIDPYYEIDVSVNGLDGHSNHKDDLIPAPEAGCPSSPLVITDSKITICHATSSETNPFNEITVSVNGLNGHGKHADDIIPAPVSGCPTTPAVIKDTKITICHATSSKTNPYNEITISVNGLNGHDKHAGDIIPAPAGGCPTTRK